MLWFTHHIYLLVQSSQPHNNPFNRIVRTTTKFFTYNLESENLSDLSQLNSQDLIIDTTGTHCPLRYKSYKTISRSFNYFFLFVHCFRINQNNSRVIKRKSCKQHCNFEGKGSLVQLENAGEKLCYFLSSRKPLITSQNLLAMQMKRVQRILSVLLFTFKHVSFHC